MTDNVETPQTEEAQAPGLSLNDLAAVVRVIDVCTKRGAFEGGELSQVGALRDKVVAFLEASGALKKPEAEGEAAPEAEAEDAA
jgi:hypothetical protein